MEVEKVLASPCHFLRQQRHHLKTLRVLKNLAVSKPFLEETRKSFNGRLIKSLVALCSCPQELPEVSFPLILGRVGYAPHQACETI